MVTIEIKMDTSIEKLPEEIILKILSYTDLGSRTLLNFGETCNKFHNIVQDPILWKKVLHFRYPKIYDAILRYGTEQYFEQYQYVLKLERRILNELKVMSPKLFWQSRDLVFEDASAFYAMCTERNISLICVHSLLADIHARSGNIIESDTPSNEPYTLTVQYYATHVLRFIMHIFLMYVWHGIKMKTGDITPEKILSFYVNWIDTFHYTHFSVVDDLLNELSNEVRKELTASHPLHSASNEQLTTWSARPIADNVWESEYNHAVHSAIRHVLYTKRELQLDRNLSRLGLHLPNVIKKKKGHPVAVAVLYEGVARRCGVRCVVVSFRDHFFLEWRESYDGPAPMYSVDLNTGKLEKKRTCPFASARPFNMNREFVPENLIDSLSEEFRTTPDIERNKLMKIKVEAINEMLHGRMGHDDGRYHTKFSQLFGCGKINQHLEKTPCFENMSKETRMYLWAEYENPMRNCANTHSAPKRTVYRNGRSSQVHFAVGMVCGHRVYNYTCVVTGWDPMCAAPPVWQTRMGVHNLAYKASQPFYNVYATDGSTRYVAQENLNLIIGQRQKIIEDVIGREFSHFNGTYYIPNEEKRSEYPDEQQIIAAYRRVPTLLMSSCKLLKPVPGHMQFFNWR